MKRRFKQMWPIFLGAALSVPIAHFAFGHSWPSALFGAGFCVVFISGVYILMVPR